MKKLNLLKIFSCPTDILIQRKSSRSDETTLAVVTPAAKVFPHPTTAERLNYLNKKILTVIFNTVLIQ